MIYQIACNDIWKRSRYKFCIHRKSATIHINTGGILRTIGDRLSKFDNLEEQTVRTFNRLFDEVPLTGHKDTDIVSIGDLTANAVTRQLLINNIATEHCFVRRTASEDDYIDLGDNSIIDDPEWLLYFV